jgi:uncharacterized protein YdeI (YjbR/CyaY-like superfamily)
MKDKLAQLSKENLEEILLRVYEVHQKDVEHYIGKLKQEETRDDKLLLGIHQTRVERIDRYVDSLLKKNES